MQTRAAASAMVIGYDGNGIMVGDCVELHPGCDLWMRGARYATVLGFNGRHVVVDVDKLAKGRRLFTADRLRRV